MVESFRSRSTIEKKYNKKLLYSVEIEYLVIKINDMPSMSPP